MKYLLKFTGHFNHGKIIYVLTLSPTQKTKYQQKTYNKWKRNSCKSCLDNNFSSAACEILSIQATQLLNEEKHLLSLLDSLSEKSKKKGEGINLHHAFKNAFFDQKRAASDILIDRITVNPDASFKLSGKFKQGK